jgi:hypothetical protein
MFPDNLQLRMEVVIHSISVEKQRKK